MEVQFHPESINESGLGHKIFDNFLKYKMKLCEIGNRELHIFLLLYLLYLYSTYIPPHFWM